MNDKHINKHSIGEVIAITNIFCEIQQLLSHRKGDKMPETVAVAAREAAQNQAARAVHHIMADHRASS